MCFLYKRIWIFLAFSELGELHKLVGNFWPVPFKMDPFIHLTAICFTLHYSTILSQARCEIEGPMGTQSRAWAAGHAFKECQMSRCVNTRMALDQTASAVIASVPAAWGHPAIASTGTSIPLSSIGRALGTDMG